MFGLTVDAMDCVSDGVNECGLYAGLQYLPSFADYPDVSALPRSDVLTPLDVASYVLASCSTVAETFDAVVDLPIGAVPTPPIGVAPLHLIVHDRAGAAGVVEWTDGVVHCYDNPLGVATNSPSFPWHLTNLSNYVHLTANDLPPVQLEGMTISQLSYGSGTLGLPGDVTSPTRFIRGVMYTQTALRGADAAATAEVVRHIMNNFDIPKGLTRSPSPDNVDTGDDPIGDYTAWTTIISLGDEVKYEIRGYEDPTWRVVQLGELDFGADGICRVPLSQSWQGLNARQYASPP